ncbi:hypothetical protein K457DRAFT_142290 [Linnemannia elongata AG-77]|uniref:Uncharacterized protein n=1 Tax=Linnemannia elongata AG-77 TaxID=1314771 RepID=A0A197JFY1_9FUNG|nr:hypothetical protein K457DRAFT_142290 [Linnemannia elongata AG-77]
MILLGFDPRTSCKPQQEECSFTTYTRWGTHPQRRNNERGFSNFLRGASNLRHLRLNNVCITTFNSGVELFTESRLTRLVCSVSQVMNPGKEQSLTASATPGTSLLVHFPALQHWTVESGPSSTEISALTQLHQAVAEYTPNLRNIQINDANSYTLTELLARVFVNLQTSSPIQSLHLRCPPKPAYPSLDPYTYPDSNPSRQN